MGIHKVPPRAPSRPERKPRSPKNRPTRRRNAMLAKMLADKKKVLVIALSGAVVLGIGAFMFSRPQDTPPAIPKPAKHLQGAKPEQLTSSPTADGKTPAGQAGGPVSVVADASPHAAGGAPIEGSRPLPPPKNNQQGVHARA